MNSSQAKCDIETPHSHGQTSPNTASDPVILGDEAPAVDVASTTTIEENQAMYTTSSDAISSLDATSSVITSSMDMTQ
ncbi:hypothetical protein BGW38_000475 [Lunasporangiospora selenospora]|uniref:Uncharacterized protein n=1 Tax=Lunasporangiospora selenospora TaxID=979761 RepID=A0A9P6FWY4_9FUNG|nr:hypothetical protein BGW38_000475 [Lunasporangiospora selenospora]